ncbi:hypothetical protein L596_002738 [Steinernema carpocapsae]|uniref:Uncharacterized protein n=1 Tax=Steinernema carpocapsae TaxID=34508 RepID=A0A4U8UU68_STECR|nr:hypothetical protein L596_002738 [Steinernema carpocapsae]
MRPGNGNCIGGLLLGKHSGLKSEVNHTKSTHGGRNDISGSEETFRGKLHEFAMGVNSRHLLEALSTNDSQRKIRPNACGFPFVLGVTPDTSGRRTFGNRAVSSRNAISSKSDVCRGRTRARHRRGRVAERAKFPA